MSNLTPKTLGINEIVPYWRNPRNATDADIAKIMSSIEEYGYANWIIVDHANTIITGHTRYLALRRLGYEEVQVYESDMTAKQAKEYRIIDNRSAEFTEWDRDALVEEIKGKEASPLFQSFFPELDLDVLGDINLGLPMPTTKPSIPASPGALKDLTCPHCYHQFELADEHLVGEAS